MASSFQKYPIKAIEYSDYHDLVIAGNEKGTLQVFKEDLTYKAAFYLHHQGIQAISMAQDYFVTVSVDGQAILSDFHSLDPIALLGDKDTKSLRCASISPFDPKRILLGGKTGTISLYDVGTRPNIRFGVDHYKCLKQYQGCAHGVGKVSWITEHHTVSFGTTDKMVKLWDLRYPKTWVAEIVHNSPIHDLCIGNEIYFLDNNAQIVTLNPWDLHCTGIYPLPVDVNQYSQMAFQSSTQSLAIASQSGQMAFMDMRDTKRGASRPYYDTATAPGELNCVSFLSCPYATVSGGDYGDVRIWETEQPGRDRETVIEPVGTGQDVFDDMQYRIDTIHCRQSIEEQEMMTIASTLVSTDTTKSKASSFLTPMRKKRRTMDAEEVDALIQSTLVFDENSSPLKKKRVTLKKFGFK